jgi:hypothetical protein
VVARGLGVWSSGVLVRELGASRWGIGSLLLAAAHERLVALGATRLGAMVLEGNELGRTIWRAAGFTPQEEWRRWVRPV